MTSVDETGCLKVVIMVIQVEPHYCHMRLSHYLFFMYLLHVEWRISSSEERILWCRSSTMHIRLEKEHQTTYPIGCFWAHAQRTGI